MEQRWKRLTVYGRVQGVGFRPTVCRLAKEMKLSGFVRNFGEAVEIVVGGTDGGIKALKQALEQLENPVWVEKIIETTLEKQLFIQLCVENVGALEQFVAVASDGTPSMPLVPADLAICKECLTEIEQPDNHRYAYPYISCAKCGPRYTIMKRLPYDRHTTTMATFELCPTCTKEYGNVADRRGHAETISCTKCGPQLYGFIKGVEAPLTQQKALLAAKELLEQGKIILVKAVGGYNLVCLADNATAVQRLRELKHRPTKPFAVLCSSLQQVEQLCIVSGHEKEVLQSDARPIVLLRKKAQATKLLAPQVAMNCPEIGIFLPPMGIFKLLSERPLIVTSCNYSHQPIIFRDEEAEIFFRTAEAVEGLFAYDREILRPADDSVAKVINLGNNRGTTVQLLRRTRGYMPEPLFLGRKSNGAVLAVGAEMEPSFGLVQGQRFYGAQIPGKLLELRTEELWQTTERDWEEFLKIKPELVVGDLHPGYSSTELGRILAREKQGNFLQVQHHHAHALAVIAEHKLEDKVLAVCFDGTGYGTDGTLWGGEFLLCQGLSYERVAHLRAIPMLGGDESMKQAWKTALCYLAAWDKDVGELNNLQLKKLGKNYELVKVALGQGINVINNSSMGRVFDAVASILDISSYNSHQGACPQALEAKAKLALDKKMLPLELHFLKQISQEGTLCWSADSLWPSLLEVDKQKPAQVEAAALGFHMAVIEIVVKTAEQLRQQKGVTNIALAGGCFANRVLLEGCLEQLQQRGFKVYFNEKVPVGDGGIALGQAYYGIMMEKTIS